MTRSWSAKVAALCCLQVRSLYQRVQERLPVVKMVAAQDFAGVRNYMNTTRDAHSHTMNATLEYLLATQRVSVEDARAATTDLNPATDEIETAKATRPAATNWPVSAGCRRHGR